MEAHNIIGQNGSTPTDESLYGTTFSNPLTIILKGDKLKSSLTLDT